MPRKYTNTYVFELAILKIVGHKNVSKKVFQNGISARKFDATTGFQA